ncbi:hypothetical protein TNCV_4798711 [Trichonephila clavipes]|nr:hypothetical protein TNCV_4798711 [Trichonephila clavipes]
MPSRLKLHSSVNSTCAVAQPIVGATIMKNQHVAEGQLLSRRAPAVHDRVEGLWFPTLAKPSYGSHLRRLIQSMCSFLVASRIHATHALQVPVSSNSCYMRAFGDGPGKFELRSSDKGDTCAGTPSRNYHTTATGGCLNSRQI